MTTSYIHFKDVFLTIFTQFWLKIVLGGDIRTTESRYAVANSVFIGEIHNTNFSQHKKPLTNDRLTCLARAHDTPWSIFRRNFKMQIIVNDDDIKFWWIYHNLILLTRRNRHTNRFECPKKNLSDVRSPTSQMNSIMYCI